MRRLLAVSIGFALVATAAGFGIYRAGLLGERSVAPPSSRRPSPLAGVVLFCVDTLRADATVPDASGRSRMPSLDAFAKGAVRFENAFAPSSWTGPSVASLLTGYVPLRHGLVNAEEGTHMPASVMTLAATLRDAGWSTYASMGGGWAGRSAGMSTGFDNFDDDFESRAPATSVALWKAWRPKDRPFFLVLHTYAAHDPWGDKSVPRRGRCETEAAADLAAGVAEAARMKAATRADVEAIRHYFALQWLAGPCSRLAITDAVGHEAANRVWLTCTEWLDRGWQKDPEGPATAARLREAYFAGLPYADRVVEETLSSVEAAVAEEAAGKPVLVVVAADHGETFGEHGAIYHARNVYEDLIHVPLYVKGPGFPAGKVVEGSCGLVDVAPTILAAAEVPGRTDLDGRSLLPLVAGTESDRAIESFVRPPAMSDDGPLRRLSVRNRRATWTAEFDTRTSKFTQESWFDRAADPLEKTPLPSLPAALADAEFLKAVETAKARTKRL